MDATTKSEHAPKKIFISYPHMPAEHTQLVDDVRELLEKDGKYKTWFDKDELKVSDDWRAGIVSGLLETDFVLAFLSEHSMRDPGVCRNEISVVLHEKSGDDLLMTALLESEDKTQAPVTVTHIQPVDLTAVEKYYPTDPQAEVNIAERDEWLKAAVEQLVQKMEAGKDIPGNMTILRKTLQPSSYIAEIAQKSAAFEGRAWLIREIKKWQEDPNGKEVFVLQGSAGVGKSAISAHLSNFRGSVFGVHFCKYNDVSTHSTNNLVRTMAFQLASRNRTYCGRLIHALSDEKYSDDKLFNIPGEQLFDELLVALTKDLDVGDTSERRMFIIDGLDEATVNGENAILKLISEKFSELPSWLRVLVTSRPEANIVEALPDTYVLNADDERNKDDVASFLRKGLGKVPALANNDDALDKAVAVATDRSDGVMLYASELLRAVGEGYVDPLNPDDFPKGLGSLYLLSLKRHCPNEQDYYEGQPAVADLLELIAGSPMPITERLLMGIGNLSAEQLNKILKRLLGTLLVRKPHAGEHADTIELFHKSFADWLVEEHEYQLNGDGAKTIGEFLYETYQSFEGIEPNQVKSTYLEDIDNLLPLCLPRTKIWSQPEKLAPIYAWFRERSRINQAEILVRRESYLYESDNNISLNRASLAISQNNLANILIIQGKFDEGEEILGKCIVAHEEVGSTVNKERLVSYLNLISGKIQRKDIRSAEKLYREMGDVFGNGLNELVDIAIWAAMVGIESELLSESGKFEEAIELQKLIIDHCKSCMNEEHPIIVTAKSNIANLKKKCGLHSEAIELFESVAKTSNIEGALILMQNMASSYNSLGRLREEVGIREKIFEVHSANFRNEHPNKILNVENLINVLHEIKDFQKASKYCDELLSIYEGVTEKENVEDSKITCQHNKAVALYNLKRARESVSLLYKVVKYREIKFGAESQECITSKHQLGIALYYNGETQKSADVLSEVIRSCSNVEWVDDTNMMNYINTYCVVLQGAKRYIELISALDVLLNIQLSVFGRESEKVAQTNSLLQALKGDHQID